VSRETAEEKAVRYLGEGRVKVRAVTPAGVEAEVQGASEKPYRTRREGHRWSCDCPAWQRQCCHVRAVRLVT
jgi:uncharacterized Zn finger protein